MAELDLYVKEVLSAEKRKGEGVWLLQFQGYGNRRMQEGRGPRVKVPVCLSLPWTDG